MCLMHHHDDKLQTEVRFVLLSEFVSHYVTENKRITNSSIFVGNLIFIMVHWQTCGVFVKVFEAIADNSNDDSYSSLKLFVENGIFGKLSGIRMPISWILMNAEWTYTYCRSSYYRQFCYQIGSWYSISEHDQRGSKWSLIFDLS